MAGAWGATVPRGGTQLSSTPPPRSRAPRPNLSIRARAPLPPRPARAPLTAGPGGAAALTAWLPLPALRAAGAFPGSPLLGRARGRGTGSGRCPRGQGQLACAPSRSGSGPPPGPGGGRWRRLGLLPSAEEGGRGCGEGSEEARPRFLEGRALLTGGAGALSRPLPAVPSPRLARPGTPGFQRLGRPNVRDLSPRVRTFEARFQGSDGARLGLLRSERRWFAPSPGWLRRSRRHLRVPSTVRSGPPTREPWG